MWRGLLPLAALAALALAACATSPLATQPVPGFADKARALVHGYADRQQFSGVLLVAVDGKPVLSEGFGLANRDTGAKPTAGTQFSLGSVSKQFTVAAVLLLEQDGKLKLDDPISKYYANSPPAWSKITLRQLMGHRSGIRNPQNIPGFRALKDPTPLQLVEFMRDTPLEFEPGTKFAYGNAGPYVLGYVIEQVTGHPYGEFIESRIFAPLDMTESGYALETSRSTDKAAGYALIGSVQRPLAPTPITIRFSAAGVYSSANDLLKWDRALYGNSLLSSDSRAQMLVDAEGDGYGLGIFARKVEGRTATYAFGGDAGYLSAIQRFTDDRVTLIALSNETTAPLEDMAAELTRLYFGLPEPKPVVAVPVDQAILERYVGVYEVFPGARVTITRQGPTLLIQQTGVMPGPPVAAPAPLTARTDRLFISRSINIDFPSGGEGPAPSVNVTVNGLLTQRPARRVSAP